MADVICSYCRRTCAQSCWPRGGCDTSNPGMPPQSLVCCIKLGRSVTLITDFATQRSATSSLYFLPRHLIGFGAPRSAMSTRWMPVGGSDVNCFEAAKFGGMYRKPTFIYLYLWKVRLCVGTLHISKVCNCMFHAVLEVCRRSDFFAQHIPQPPRGRLQKRTYLQ